MISRLAAAVAALVSVCQRELWCGYNRRFRDLVERTGRLDRDSL